MSKMIDEPEKYFRQMIPRRHELLVELETEAEREGIPIVGPVVGQLLFILAAAARAQRILELGTATGYSTIYLARACRPQNGRVVTLENNSDMASRAQENLHKAGVADLVEVRQGDALEELTRMADDFDFVFMDIEKSDYIRVLPDCRRLLVKGGLLVADNVGFKDADAFNRAISGDPDWTSVALFSYLPFHSPEYDGLCLAIRQ